MTQFQDDSASPVGFEPTPSAKLLEQLVAEAPLLNRPANLQVALRIGELLQSCLKHAAGASGPSMARPSYKELALSANLGRSSSVLWRCVKIYELSVELPAIKTFVHLSTTHVRCVVNLPREQQELLLTQAESERWTCVQLEKAVAEFRRGSLRVEAEHGRESGFFERPGVQLLRNLAASLTQLKRASSRSCAGLPVKVQGDIGQRLQELQRALDGFRVALAEGAESNQLGKGPNGSAPQDSEAELAPGEDQQAAG